MRPFFRRLPLAVACAMIGSGTCLAQAAERPPSPDARSRLASAAPSTPVAATSRITVLSALGQPLRAELDIDAPRGEGLDSLSVRLASAAAFRWAGLEYAPVLSTVRFTLDRRSDGKPYFRMETDHAINDPFINLLVELSWSSGRLVRKYTLLLDPPGQGSGAAIVAAGLPVKAEPAEAASPSSPLIKVASDAAGQPPSPPQAAQPDQDPALPMVKSFLAASREKTGAAPCQKAPLLLAQANISGLQPGSALRMTDAYTPLLETDGTDWCEGGPILLAQADTTALAGMQVALANLPRPERKGASALIQVADAAAPRAGEGSALLLSSASPAKRRSKPGNNMKIAQKPANGNGGAKGAEATGVSQWVIPPINWSGDASFDLMTSAAQGSPRVTRVFETVGVRADSYIYQPWFARVGGGLRLSMLNSGLTKGLATDDSGSNTVTGNGHLLLFPVSRFPFSASYDVTDSKTTGELVPNGYTSRRLTLTQSYAPLTSSANYQLNFDRSTITSDLGGTDIANSLTGMMNDHRGFHDYHLDFYHYTDTQKNTGNSSEMDRISANHSYRPGTTFSIDSMMSLGKSSFDLAGPSATNSRDSYLQMNSFATWRPAENSPLMMTGGARLYQSNSDTNGNETDARTVSGNAAATYLLNRNVVLTAAATATQVSVADKDISTTSVMGGANYSADAIRLGEYIYGWGGGVTTTHQGSSAQESQNTTSMQIAHNLNRGFMLAENSSVQINANQSFVKNTGTLTYQTLSTNGSASWNYRPTDASTTMLGVNATDTNSTGNGLQQHFQLINLQANGQMRINRYSSAGANMTIQGTRQLVNTFSSATSSGEGFNWSASGSLNYNHTQAFGVQRLRYTAMFNVNQFRNQSRLDGNINAPVEQINQSLEQHFDYDIGRTTLQLQMRYAEMANRSSEMIFFRVVRLFGNY